MGGEGVTDRDHSQVSGLDVILISFHFYHKISEATDFIEKVYLAHSLGWSQSKIRWLHWFGFW